jgi:chromosome segregation ATPase
MRVELGPIHVHVHFEGDARIDGLAEKIDRLDRFVRQAFTTLKQEGVEMAGEIDRLQTSVTNISTVIGSAETAFHTMAEQIRQMRQDPARLSAYADELDAKAAALSQAMVAGTVAEGEQPST